MDTELKNRLDALERKIDAIYGSAEKTRKYFLWTLIAAVVTFVLPLIALAFLIPFYISQLTGMYAGLL